MRLVGRVRALIDRRRRDEEGKADGREQQQSVPTSVAVGEIYGFVGAVSVACLTGEQRRRIRVARRRHRADATTSHRRDTRLGPTSTQ